MKHILILLTLIFSMVGMNAQATSAEQDFDKGSSRFSEENYQEAFDWHEKAALRGHARAQFAIGSMYQHGQGVDQNYTLAFYWYIKSAKQGYAEAQFNLAAMYYQGLGVEQSYKQALGWWKKAALQGHADAQYILGELYYYGQGVEQNDVLAYMWYTIATLHKNKQAQEKIKIIAKRMSAEQKTEAQYKAIACSIKQECE